MKHEDKCKGLPVDFIKIVNCLDTGLRADLRQGQDIGARFSAPHHFFKTLRVLARLENTELLLR